MKFYLALITVCTGLAFAQSPPPHTVFDKDAVHEIRLRFPNADWYEVLTANYSGTEAENPYFPAALEWGQYKFDQVGVRFKGNSSYRVSSKKKPFRIKLNEFTKGQKIEGLASFSLSNAWNDPSFVREKPYYEMAAAMGLKAPRSNFAALYINDEYWGLYVLGEVVNGDFLTNYFGKGEDAGNLYKGNIGASFAHLGEDKATYKQVWEKQTNETADDWTDLIDLCRVITNYSGDELRARLDSVMDVDSVLTALALDNATVNLDSYVGMGQNFNIYRRASDNRWVWIPWDPSLAFGALSQGQTVEGMQQLTLEWTGGFGGGAGGGGGFPGGGQPPTVPPGGVPPTLPPGGVPPGGGNPGGGNPGGGGGAGGFPGGGAATAGRPLATKLWEIPAYKERYRQIYQQLMEKVFLGDRVVARMNALRTMIRPWVERDTQKLVTMAQFDQAMTATGSASADDRVGIVGGSIPGLQPFIEARVASVKTQLAATAVGSIKLQLSESTLAFSQPAGGTAITKILWVAYDAPPATASPFYTLRATTESGGSWLTLSPTGGGNPGWFKVSVDGSKLTAGSYKGSIVANLQGSSNGPLTLPVTLTVTAESTAATPLITSVVNAASYETGKVAPGEILALFGANLGPAKIASGTVANGSFDTKAGGVQVTFDSIPAPILYARADQLGVVVPFEVTGKSQVDIQVINNGVRSVAVRQTVVAAVPGIFSVSSTGVGPGAIVNESGLLNALSTPAAKNSTVTIYLTGAGQVKPAGATGALASAATLQSLSGTATVTIGGETAVVRYAGAVPGSVLGLYQINAIVPSSSPIGDVPVVVTVDGRSSPERAATLYIK